MDSVFHRWLDRPIFRDEAMNCRYVDCEHKVSECTCQGDALTGRTG